ncbi:MAG: methyltransferase domain-containing protein [Pseudomonadota bacterium]
MSDPKTLAFYSTGAGDYARFVGDGSDNPWLIRFMDRLPPECAVLDFGCGHGWASAVMKAAGMRVTAMDGSEGFAAEAKIRYDLDVKIATFDELADVDAFDGLWVSFSLLHDRREAFSDHLIALRRAARSGALLYLGLKEGEGRQRDTLGRLYTYFSETEVRAALDMSGWQLALLERQTEKGLAGTDDVALHIFATTR